MSGELFRHGLLASRRNLSSGALLRHVPSSPVARTPAVGGQQVAQLPHGKYFSRSVAKHSASAPSKFLRNLFARSAAQHTAATSVSSLTPAVVGAQRWQGGLGQQDGSLPNGWQPMPADVSPGRLGSSPSGWQRHQWQDNAGANSNGDGGGGGKGRFWSRPAFLVGAGLIGGVIVQTHLGMVEDFFDSRYVTSQANGPDDLLEFYQAEELLKIFTFGIPFVFKFVMAGVRFEDDPGEGWDAKTTNPLLGMEVCFSLEEEQEEADDGENVVTYFSRHERFGNYIPFTSILLWSQTWNYGFKRLDDGKFEVWHKGDKFYGPFPIRLGVWMHQWLVVRLCQKHVNSPAFGKEEAADQLFSPPTLAKLLFSF